METDIQKFYKNKNVFLTGGSGFLGKVFIEKILRSTDVNCIYMLIRSKKGTPPADRIEDIFKNSLFDELHKLKANSKQRIVPILGDCQLPNLGLSAEDRQTLIQQVDVVIHAAATVRFNEPLYNALAINVRATRDLMQLAKQMSKLKAFVHVSSAFANCTVWHIDEVYYTEKLCITAEKMCQVAELSGPELTNRMTGEWCGEFPNTYTFTKALAEEAVLAESGALPICIFRPGIVIPTYTEPMPGWVDNLYGPMSVLYGVAHGVLRVLYVRMQASANFVPVDMCVNLMLAAACNIAKTVNQSNEPAPIYNLVPDENNMLNWSTYKKAIEEHGPKMPITKMIWFPFAITVESKFLYNILIYIYHILPGYIFDLLLMLRGKKRRMIAVYRKIHLQTAVLDYFVEHEWTFSMHNTKRLWNMLSPQDQNLYNFNMRDINWSDYFYTTLLGLRTFLGNEGPETIPRGKQIMHRLHILHRAVQFVVYGGGSTLLSWTLLKILHYV